MELIRFESVSKTIDTVDIIKDFELSVNKGEIVGLIGPNGAGKTTILRLMSNLYKPTSGRIIRSYSTISAVLDKDAVYNNLTSYEQLNYSCLLKKGNTLSFDEYEEVMKEVGLDIDNKKVSKFSKGMKKRLSIASAIISSPELIVLDEPFTGLDPDGQYMMQNIIKNISLKSTVILSSHNLDLLNGVITRAIYLYKKKLLDTKMIDETKLKDMYFKIFNNIER